jgi:hypothetical protein
MIFSSDQVHGFNDYRQFVAELGMGGRDQRVKFLTASHVSIMANSKTSEQDDFHVCP